jgi:hypothetical protein
MAKNLSAPLHEQEKLHKGFMKELEEKDPLKLIRVKSKLMALNRIKAISVKIKGLKNRKTINRNSFLDLLVILIFHLENF